MKSVQGERSYENQKDILSSKICGCYFCLNVYESKLVKDYVKDKNGFTAICPKCGIDSVVPFDLELDSNPDLFKLSPKAWRKDSFW